MQPNTERRTVTIAAQGYNDCFCLANKSKQVMYVNKNGELRKAHKKDDNYYHRYHLYYEEAQDTIAYYNHVNGGGDTLSISLYLENAQYNGRHILTLDFDKLVDAQGNKEPIDTESPAFKDLQEAADIVTRSTSGGYHMYYGIDKQKADTLFQEINLLCATEGSYVCKVRQFSADKRIKVDFFCDTPRLIYEPNGWDINKPLTDKTEVICELIKKHFLFAAEQKQAPKREKQTVSKEHKRQRTHREYADIEELDEADLTAQMDALQLSVFRHLMGNISPNCSRPEWYKHGINILCVFGPELGGEVFYFWSKDYADFDYSEMRTEWSAIVSKEDAELRNKDW